MIAPSASNVLREALAVEAFPLGELQQLLAQGAPRVALAGLEGSALAYLLSLLPGEPGSPRLVITPDAATAETLARDLRFFLGERDDPAALAGVATRSPRGLGHEASAVLDLPVMEVSPYSGLSPDRRTMLRRLRTLTLLAQPELAPEARFLVLAAENLQRRVLPLPTLQRLTLWLARGDRVARDELALQLAGIGYSRVQLVEEPGCFSVRGGTVDVFSPLYPWPLRLELFDDEVEGLRFFDPAGQRSLLAAELVVIPPAREEISLESHLGRARERILEVASLLDLPSSKARQVLADLGSGIYFFGVEALAPAFHESLAPLETYLPPHGHRVLLDPAAAEQRLAELAEQLVAAHARRSAEGVLVFPPEEHLVLGPAALEASRQGPHLQVGGLRLGVADAREAAAPSLHFGVERHPARFATTDPDAAPEDSHLAPFARQVHRWLREGQRVGLVVGSRGRAERARELLRTLGFPVTIEERGLSVRAAGDDGLQPGALRIVVGELSAGFDVPAHGLVVVHEAEVFGERVQRPRRARQAVGEGLLAAFQELSEGDLVVHREHGVGRYRALVKLVVGGLENDYLLLEYSGSDRLYLPVQRLDMIHRYVGGEGGGGSPSLDKLGGVGWARTRRKVKEGVEQLARELLQLHASRTASRGIVFPEPDELFRELEARFPYEETPDQADAIAAVLEGMTQPGCMDHLVCGDVGYGKTEVALRAAFLAALGGAQVAVLCPTTVLAAQHLATFRERYQGFPVRVEGLSRFTPPKEVPGILQAVREGRVDVLVGTHRILNKDVEFRRLGLVVVDEEQRFGVKQKERLKVLRTEVDVLTLTATPIPRTLNMALSGLKDISIIATAPVDRQSIRTFVTQWDPGVIREAVLQELSRGGQVFYVHNRVQHLPEVHQRLRELVPEARIGVAHGQMAGEAVERVMLAFMRGEINVLLCTAIIESGLDIPRANTMVIEDAHTFGLAQLYQLRGRVGRSKHRAFAYLVVPPRRSLTEQAAKRIEALQRFTELGAGFQIASLDLELRGAGDLLGAEQSGSVQAVGFELYTRMLEEAVQELQGTPVTPEIEPELKLGVSARLPEEYLPDTGLRLGMYKRLSRAASLEEVGVIQEELIDRFGPAPAPVTCLIRAMEIKALARQAGIAVVERLEGRVSFEFGREPPDTARVLELLNRRRSPWRATAEMVLSHPVPAAAAEALPAIRDLLQELLGHATETPRSPATQPAKRRG